MRIADVVKNSVWHDPRVRKQIFSYAEKHEVIAVGVNDSRYSKEDIERLPAKVLLPASFPTKKLSFFGKVLRELSINKALTKSLIAIKPDVIHANDLNALIPCYAAAKKLKHCVLVYDTHELFLENPWMIKHPLVRRVWAHYEKKLIHRADLILCVTSSARDYLLRRYGELNIEVVTNSVALSSVMQPKTILGKTHLSAVIQGQFYVGRGYPETIAAAGLCDSKIWTISLRGFGSLEASLREQANSLPSHNVVFEPPVKTYELIEAASRSDVGLAITNATCDNYRYSISNKIFEYAAAGLPVIMSDIPEHRKLNDLYGLGVILPSDTPEEIAKALEKFQNDVDFYERCSLGAITMAKATSWDNQFSHYLDILGGLHK